MREHEKWLLLEHINKICDIYGISYYRGIEAGYKVDDVRNAILSFQEEATEGGVCCSCENTHEPDYEAINDELRKELDYWKNEHRSLREHNIRLEAIVRTIEQIVGKNFLD